MCSHGHYTAQPRDGRPDKAKESRALLGVSFTMAGGGTDISVLQEVLGGDQVTLFPFSTEVPTFDAFK